MAAAPKLAVMASPTRLEPGDILTAEELAARLKVPVSWVYTHIDKKSDGRKLPFLKCGIFLRFSWPEVCAWLRPEKD